MKIKQFVMAYEVEQDRLRAILPKGFLSLRPVLRINAEITDSYNTYLEFNTAVEKNGFKGWLNIGNWDNIRVETEADITVFKTAFLDISFTRVGVKGSCPAENDNDGCCFISGYIRPPELITDSKEFCDCEFKWSFKNGSYGKSIGKTLPAIPNGINNIYPQREFSVENAAIIPCKQVLGSYVVEFFRR